MTRRPLRSAFSGGLAGLVLLGACGRRAEPAACARYASLPDAWAFCVRQEARRADAAGRDALCGRLLGPDAVDCRTGWVEAHLSGDAREVLLAACPNDDCRLTVLDAHPGSTIDAQLRECRDLAGALGPDCAIHALGRWWRTRPDENAAAILADASLPFADERARWLGALEACRSVGSCDGWPALSAPCRRAADDLRAHPERCP